jgi:hypothetical protein
MATREPTIFSDRKRGKYFYVYANYIRGKRINKLSIEAEAWFWRFNAAADDFGNGDAEPALLFANTIGLRAGVTIEQVSAWLTECVKQKLIRTYKSDGQRYFHIMDYQVLTPTKNGRYVHKVPKSQWDIEDDETLRNLRSGETKKNRGQAVGAGVLLLPSSHTPSTPSSHIPNSHIPPPSSPDPKPEPASPAEEEELAIARNWLRREGVKEEELGLYAGIRHFPGGPKEAVAIAVGNANATPDLKDRTAYIESCLRDLPKLRLKPKAQKARPPAPPTEEAVVDEEQRRIDRVLNQLPKSEFELHRTAVEAGWTGAKSEALVRLRIYQRITRRAGTDARASPVASSA